MTIADVLFFDSESTGTFDRKLSWETDFDQFQHIVQLSWIHGCKVENHIIRPDGWEIPEEATAIHGITTAYALEHGEPFAIVADMFIQDCHEAALLCGHSIHFDTSLVKANILRELGKAYFDANDVNAALYKGKRLDTMSRSMKWVDARTSTGRLKFPTLTELYSRCYPGETFPAHDGLEDTKAVMKCLPVLLEMGLLELKVKEYAEQETDPGTQAVRNIELASNAAKIATDAAKEVEQIKETHRNGPISHDNSRDDKLHVQEKKVAQSEKMREITQNLAALLEQDDF